MSDTVTEKNSKELLPWINGNKLQSLGTHQRAYSSIGGVRATRTI
jgi:hypothetical protein